MGVGTVDVEFATASGRCVQCRKDKRPLWVLKLSGRRLCASCMSRVCPAGFSIRFGTESDKQEARRREKTPTG